jgi:predicted phage-related endonuclease
MVSDKDSMTLHDRATRGENLSSEEYKILESWYKIQDDNEAELFHLHAENKTEPILQKQIDGVLAGIRKAYEEIWSISEDNKILKNEIVELHKKLSQRTMAHSV